MTTGPDPKRRRTRAHTVDEATVRSRCADSDAAEYTLYIRHLIDYYLGLGGQAEVLRIAGRRGILPAGLNRQALSEQLNGRYKHGPNWSTTDVVIACLPDICDTASIRATAAGWYIRARREHPPRYKGPVSMPPDSQPLENVPESGPNIPQLQAKIAQLKERLAADTAHLLETLKKEKSIRREAERRADRHEADYHRERQARLGLQVSAAEVATLREAYARQAVQLELLQAPGLRTTPLVDLPALPDARQRVRLGHLVQTIDPNAPPACRALARYLCVYAEFAGITPAELSVRAGLHAETIYETLAAQRVPTGPELHELAEVLKADPHTIRELAAHARRRTVEDPFWQIADALNATTDASTAPHPPTGTSIVGNPPDNRSTKPDTRPTQSDMGSGPANPTDSRPPTPLADYGQAARQRRRPVVVGIALAVAIGLILAGAAIKLL
ncbi:helix-turn-helix domain-containing protein [Plantactinospora endophytica]|uniref:Uncharacterized protein n=1 Tax=Plantactinospora endophytica TaxID=673535 RepID=A0ABQ4EE81_9ACTN|nr:helix-turn-helix domain-containing protein [Plantactinospora endophytica]GIG93037.1 hypothetical protein Pen02_79730 [Plantactinospora endophytica]